TSEELMDDRARLKDSQLRAQLGVHARELEDRRADAIGPDGIGDRILGARVALPDHASALDACARPDRRVATVPMVPSHAPVHPRRAAELAHAYDERRLEKAALAEIVEKRGERAIEDGSMPIVEELE